MSTLMISHAIIFIVSNKSQARLVPALERGLDVLEWLAKQQEPVTLTGIAHGLGLAVSEVQRPVACLLDRGYLHRQATGGYVMSGLMAQLAANFPPHWRLQQVAFAPMSDFSRKHGESIHLCVPDGEGALLLLDVPGGGLVRISLQQGARLDGVNSVSGRLLTAYGCLPLKGKASQKTFLKKITARGYEIAESAHAVGIIDVGVPVRNSNAQVVAALTMSCLCLRKGKQTAVKLVPRLLDCSREISKLL